MSKSRMTKKEKQRIAREHIEHLYKEAIKVFSENPGLAHDYAKEIRKSAMRVNLSLPSKIRRRVCRKCNHFLMPGNNCRVRTTNHHIVSKCEDCGYISRFGFLREQKSKRKQ